MDRVVVSRFGWRWFVAGVGAGALAALAYLRSGRASVSRKEWRLPRAREALDRQMDSFTTEIAEELTDHWWHLPYSPAQDQRHSDHCAAYAVVAAMETWMLTNGGARGAGLRLSEADLLQFANTRRLRPSLEAVRDIGMVSTDAPESLGRMSSRERRRNSSRYWRIEFTEISGDLEIVQSRMKEALHRGLPLVTQINVDDHFWRNSLALPYRPSAVAGPAHAICIVGLVQAEQLWVAKNSKGPDWGINGCFTFPMGYSLIDAEYLVYQVDRVLPPSA